MDLQFYEKEKREMAETQLHFIKYAAEEILEYVAMGGKIEEWYQNKLSKVHSDMEGMHSWMEGEKRRTGMVREETEQLDEISMQKLTQYKTAAAKSASEADKAGDIKKGDKRFSGIMRATKKQFAKTTNEDVEQIDELSKTTLGSYAKRAAYDATTRGIKYGEKMNQSGSNTKELNKINKRETGVHKAIDRLAKESVNEGENPQVKGGDPCWKGYEMVGMKKKGGKEVPNCVPVKEQKNDVPFSGPYTKQSSTVTDKSGAKHGPSSTVKHLARMAQKKQVEKLKKPVNESLQESRRVEIVREAMKDAKLRDEKKRKDGEVKGKKDAFEPNPTLTSQIVKTSS